jgi:heterodisulfide reductase subunit C
MKSYYIAESALRGFVENLMGQGPVVAPVAKRTRFVFAELASADDLRLDYDTTILPPKKAFFPAKQDVIAFGEDGGKACIEPTAQVLLGVHPHDIKGIAMADTFYRDNLADHHYLANREAATIIGANVQNHYARAFFGSVATEMAVSGHDMFLTKIDGGYHMAVLTEKGQALVKHGEFLEATDEQNQQAEAVNKAAEDNCPEKLSGTSDEIRKKVRDCFKSEIWKELSDDCFSCGSCNTVCPTCFCFDVQDHWNLDMKSGVRCRTWDACLTSEFSEVSVQGGCENFREERAERFRHRFMRKAAYLNDQLGAPACIGCGRCAGACTADIADPTNVINTIMERG